MPLIIRSSAIHAAGCYTVSTIRKGAKVVEYTGPRITKDEGDLIYETRALTYLFGIGNGKYVIDGHGMAMFINHSCEPNCDTFEDDEGRVWIGAIRNIAPGEELTYDYLLYDGDEDQPCYCGAPACRGTMFSPKELKKRAKRLATGKKR